MRVRRMGDPVTWLRAFAGLRAVYATSRRAIEAHQSRQLRRIVRHAARHVPYYRRLFERERIDPDDIRRPADLAHLPILTRPLVRQYQDNDLLSDNCVPAALVTRETNGTSGYSLHIHRTVFEDRFLQGVRLLHNFSLGLRPWHLRVSVSWLDPKVPSDINDTWWTRLGILRQPTANCIWEAEDILDYLRNARPDILIGYPASLAWVAEHVPESERPLIRPRHIQCGGEALTPLMRRQITETFDARVYDYYGANEFNLVATECPAGTGRYHLCEATLIAEVLRDGRPCEPGETGEFIATALYSYAMPFIRYRLGDEVVAGESPCPCGAPCRTLRSIDGRLTDRFLLPSGRTVHPYVLEVPLLDHAPWMCRFQIVQERIDRILLNIVPMPGQQPSQEALETLAKKCGAGVDGAEVAVRLVDDIPFGPGGKFRLYVPLRENGQGAK